MSFFIHTILKRINLINFYTCGLITARTFFLVIHILIKKDPIMEFYVVSSGDTLFSIADLFGISPSRLAYDNQIFNREPVVGEVLIINIPDITHTIVEGDTLSSIAKQYNTNEKNILRHNPQLLFQNSLIIGESIIISFQDSDNKKSSISVNGYAYPFISKTILYESLLYLTELYIFSYGFTPEGNLIPIDDVELISAAIDFGVKPILVLTALDNQGYFSNELIHSLLSNENSQNSLIVELISVMTEKSYAGVDVDFEFILADDKNSYVDFIAQLTQKLNEQGFQVTVALPPKTSDEQSGLLYEGIDYAGIGNAANYVLLMTYEWGYTYGPPMAVAPIPNVRQVLEYAITRISPDKINMGIPNYGYDWPLPYVSGKTAATSIGNAEAIQIAYENTSSILYDNVSQAPFFYYTDLDSPEARQEHVVWFEDIRSFNAKYSLINEYGFNGIGYWQLMRLFRANWFLVLESFYIR